MVFILGLNVCLHHRLLFTTVLMNWAGPPGGKFENWFLDNEICVRFSSELRRPSGRLEIRLFSTLNCSKALHLANEHGMELKERRLYLEWWKTPHIYGDPKWRWCLNYDFYYLNPIRVRCTKFPMESGRLANLLCWRSKVRSWVHSPISGGIVSNWLYDISNVTRPVRFPIEGGRDLRWSRQKSHVTAHMKNLWESTNLRDIVFSDTQIGQSGQVADLIAHFLDAIES